MSSLPDRSTFESAYAGQAPWDIGRPQQAFLDVADRITGSVLDAGCGTGDNALFFASRGHKLTGIDFLEEPITRARRKAPALSLASSLCASRKIIAPSPTRVIGQPSGPGTARSASPARTARESCRSTQPSPTVAVASRPNRSPVPGSIRKTDAHRPASLPSQVEAGDEPVVGEAWAVAERFQLFAPSPACRITASF
jgi:hypothetical protein